MLTQKILLLGMLVILFSPIYLTLDIGVSLILNRLLFWHKRVLKETYQFRKILATNIIEGFMDCSIIEFDQMGNIVIEIGLSILRNLIQSFASVVNSILCNALELYTIIAFYSEISLVEFGTGPRKLPSWPYQKSHPTER